MTDVTRKYALEAQLKMRDELIDELEAEIKELKLHNGLQKIELENRARLLNSCETALRERDGL